VCPVACPSVEKGNTKNGCVLLQTGHEVVRCGRAQGTASNVSAQRVLRFLSFWLAFATRLCLKRRMSSTNTHVGHNSQFCNAPSSTVFVFAFIRHLSDAPPSHSWMLTFLFEDTKMDSKNTVIMNES
jgi:hypothetical protein